MCKDADDTVCNRRYVGLGLSFEHMDDTQYACTSGWRFGVDDEGLGIEAQLLGDTMHDSIYVTETIGEERLRVVEGSEVGAGVREERLVELVFVLFVEDVGQTLCPLLSFVACSGEDGTDVPLFAFITEHDGEHTRHHLPRGEDEHFGEVFVLGKGMCSRYVVVRM